MPARPVRRKRAPVRRKKRNNNKSGSIMVWFIRPGGGVIKKRIKPTSKVLSVKGIPGAYYLDEHRFLWVDGTPIIQFIIGRAEAVDPYGTDSAISADELDEVGRNNYVQQVMTAMQLMKEAKIMLYIAIGIAVLSLANLWFTNGVANDLSELREFMVNWYLADHPAAAATTTGG